VVVPCCRGGEQPPAPLGLLGHNRSWWTGGVVRECWDGRNDVDADANGTEGDVLQPTGEAVEQQADDDNGHHQTEGSVFHGSADPSIFMPVVEGRTKPAGAMKPGMNARRPPVETPAGEQQKWCGREKRQDCTDDGKTNADPPPYHVEEAFQGVSFWTRVHASSPGCRIRGAATSAAAFPGDFSTAADPVCSWGN
jgi:hypothetical protein